MTRRKPTKRTTGGNTASTSAAPDPGTPTPAATDQQKVTKKTPRKVEVTVTQKTWMKRRSGTSTSVFAESSSGSAEEEGEVEVLEQGRVEVMRVDEEDEEEQEGGEEAVGERVDGEVFRTHFWVLVEGGGLGRLTVIAHRRPGLARVSTPPRPADQACTRNQRQIEISSISVCCLKLLGSPLEPVIERSQSVSTKRPPKT
ncbi:hypothetical protein BDK51DRAFT_35145 [Blyttiomyces helicus]|uniref:Uncharacterized protein n=1 Tax=Blyttiomyces helicus TaxID=388810 RepID=A0A4P9W2P0_9FUNG|nr:hypothetical protein BDK51DRAFT_35145 [Blyttiomyces helicus]|eukprot:RKO85443.1 hypothetical protein BDK51DRAFT_35145 [Blyttiomyces helicus]